MTPHKRYGLAMIAAGICLFLVCCATAPRCPDGQVEVGRTVTQGHSQGGGFGVDSFGNIVAADSGRHHKQVTLQCVPRELAADGGTP